MKKTATLIAVIALIACCGLTTRAADLLKPVTLSFESGKIAQEGLEDLYQVSLFPTYTYRNFSATLGLNLVFARDNQMRDGGNDSVTVEKIDYSHGDRLKLHYGDIENLTLGSGFVVSNYRSDIRGNVSLNRQKDLQLDLKSSESHVKMFATRSRLLGVRAIRNFGLYNLGTTVVTDSEPDFSEISVDAEIIIIPEKYTLYVERAGIVGHGEGYAAGILATPLKNINAKVEFRNFDADFAPGFVDEHYEARAPFDRITSYEGRRMGVYSAIDFFFDSPLAGGSEEQIAGRVTFEDYEEYQRRATINVTGPLTRNIRGELFFAKENFVAGGPGERGEDSVARARLYIKFSRRGELILDYYNGYDDKPIFLESLGIKARFKLF